ncbi:mitochondrial fission ELM1 family protein [Alphaproteobacteria bacterium]|nr:ELM1/GtrOC1 family putative glycosyltransferase [Alphaproteobacteria bacterium]MDC3270353.1 mitochondrial fission ELM1 family protein [Alphaproteobacteria bacterium]
MNLEKIKIWAVTDGSKGMISQAIGLSNQISKNITEIKTDLIFPWNKIQPGFLPVYKWIFKNKFPNDNEPNIVISCGRKSIYFSLYCKKIFKNLINIHIQNPKISSKNFNFVISPNHDNLNGYNVINSIGALHHLNKNNENVNQNLITCIIGGDNQHYHFDNNEANRLCNKLIEIKNNQKGLEFNIITSRRTSYKVKEILIKKLKNIAKIWTGEGKNPYLESIQKSSFFIVTSDSTSMISEAAISGKPIYVYHLAFKRKSKRIENFHKEFSELGITKDIINFNHLSDWTYDSLNESERIAIIIKKRIIKENI